MEKYVKLSDIEKIIEKLIHEPAYQHEDEDFYSGVCAVESGLTELSTIEIEEPKLTATWIPTYEGFLGSDYQCSNCRDLAEEGNTGHYNKLTEYCPHCGAKMSER